jgi:enterochelin esterase family protein
MVQASQVQISLTVDSKLLHKPIAYSVYIPDAPAPEGGWPVLYLLHGLNGNETDWVNAGGIKSALDEAISGKKLPPLVAIMPMAGNSWYVDDARPAGLGPVATSLLTEFIPEVEKRYGLARCREARAIGGVSMGGYGSLLYGLDRPDLFGAAISLSGSIFPEEKDLDPARETLLVSLFKGVFGEPFSRRRYQDWNLFPKLRRLAGEANKPALYITASDDDFPRQLLGAATFQIAALSASFKTELRVEDGTHSWRYWARAIKPALIWLANAIPLRCPLGR